MVKIYRNKKLIDELPSKFYGDELIVKIGKNVNFDYMEATIIGDGVINIKDDTNIITPVTLIAPINIGRGVLIGKDCSIFAFSSIGNYCTLQGDNTIRDFSKLHTRVFMKAGTTVNEACVLESYSKIFGHVFKIDSVIGAGKRVIHVGGGNHYFDEYTATIQSSSWRSEIGEIVRGELLILYEKNKKISEIIKNYRLYEDDSVYLPF